MYEERGPVALERLLRRLIAAGDGLPEEDEPLGRLTREFLANNWIECRDGLLARTERIRIRPELSPAPRAFRFEIDCAYKRKASVESAVELVPGPVSGEVIYRADLFTNPGGPCLVVLIDRHLHYFHPNYSRRHGFLCIGESSDLLAGPLPLDQLMENHVFPIVSYQNRRATEPADAEAARYFALDPTAMVGLEPVAALY